MFLVCSHIEGSADDLGQTSLLADGAPATIAVKQADGGFVYVPLRLATVEDIDGATRLRADNIANVQKAYDKWEKQIMPIRTIMANEGVSYPDAERLYAERHPPEPDAKKA